MPHRQLNRERVQAVEAVLEKAHGAGRSMLFEHEVYVILELLGLNVPSHHLVASGDEVDAGKLSRFSSDRVVLKVVAGDVAHKQKIGGVRVAVKDADFIRYSVDRMLSDMKAAGHEAEGVLLVECIDYSQDLGNEILLGFRESDAFGPVISFSKGGSDAEHFAQSFSPPNLILAPIDRKWAEALLYSTQIQKKFAAQGHTDYTDKIIDAGLRFSRLSTAFSNFFEGDRFVIREFEVNPFVFDRYGRFIAIDGYAVFEKRNEAVRALGKVERAPLTPFFEPEGVAVIGVSTSNLSSPGSTITENLIKLGRTDVYAVNPKGGELPFASGAVPVHTSLADIGRPVDLAIVSVPAAHALPVVEQCAEAGVRAAILIPGGFSETGNDDVEASILAVARKTGMRLMGPNCLGIIFGGNQGRPGINTFFVPEEKFRVPERESRNVAILSQSGALGIIELHQLRHAISPKVIVSYGNQLDTDPADLIGHFSQDDDVDVIGCYIEGFKPAAGARFFHVAGQCPKPVIVYKAGRTEAGRKATESHTASIAGEYAVAKAAMKQAGLVVAETMMDHVELIKTFALLNDFEVRGNRLAVIANAGYEKTYAADNLGSLQVAEFDQATTDSLRKVIPPFVDVDPLLDLTPMADDNMYAQCIEIALASDSVDALVVSIVPHAMDLKTTDSEMESDPDNIAARIVQLAKKYRKPVAVSVCVTGGADADYNRFGQTLDQGGVPTFLNASRATQCLNEFIRYRMIRRTGDYAEWLK
ncbi:acetate--CoA ligase family protein [Salidesulfovibrio onnuriiensis]|uniref:acetate--CoA ligase family protein n=1 Tax=Salidesulfovibrio onnuriiensis TaxID=2583823 RepID=UPI0011CBC43C|nr:acetate--CoA ligase family protein [Salidesulfovibrio onnuriiensis]